jgi:hypothetical protein
MEGNFNIMFVIHESLASYPCALLVVKKEFVADHSPPFCVEVKEEDEGSRRTDETNTIILSLSRTYIIYDLSSNSSKAI